ncbi:neuromedin-U receptor 2-like isoform X3 [Portunus trituberculatus]|uniref:neuromedin-U receptor 2-like isoform X3 n=1 Tax=Portunus trituberculatus TaxID=210409 RepID=UPI001E1CFA8B|nr:neuromedin-U receptor 2-like isoform X3 [Portunus trituberculatus]
MTSSTSADPSSFADMPMVNASDDYLLEASFNDSVNGTCDVCSYIESKLGKPRLRYPILLPMTAMYCVIAVGGAIGNVLTCLVVAKNRTMRTSTNYYLVNLAVADLLTLFLAALPMEVYSMWVQYPWPWGEAACRLRAMMPELVAHVSVLTILAVSGERYVAITNPVYARTTHTLARTARVVPVIWLLSLVAAVPWGYYYQVNQLQDQAGVDLPQSSWCSIPYQDKESRWSWLIWLSSVGAFILPMTILIFLYCRIGMVLSMDPPARTPTAGNGAIHTRRMGIRMLAVVVAFFLCWAPFHAQRLMFAIVTSKDQWTDTLFSVHTKLFCFTGACYYLNSAVNPLLYSVMSVRFRNALRRSLCGGRDWARRQQLYFSNTTHGHLQLSNNSNILLRTREFSLTSSRRFHETSNRNGVHYGFEHMDMEA